MFDFPSALLKLVATHQERTMKLFLQQCLAVNDKGISVHGPNEALRRRLIMWSIMKSRFLMPGRLRVRSRSRGRVKVLAVLCVGSSCYWRLWLVLGGAGLAHHGRTFWMVFRAWWTARVLVWFRCPCLSGSFLTLPIRIRLGDLCLSAHIAPLPVQKKKSVVDCSLLLPASAGCGRKVEGLQLLPSGEVVPVLSVSAHKSCICSSFFRAELTC